MSDIEIIPADTEKPLIKWQCWEVVGVEVFLWADDLPKDINPLYDLPTIKDRDGLKAGDFVIVASVFGWGKAVVKSSPGRELWAESLNGKMYYPLEFATDRRKCWVCSGAANIAALKKLDLR